MVTMQLQDGSKFSALAPAGDYPIVDAGFDEYSMLPGDAVFYQSGMDEDRLVRLSKDGKFLYREHDGGVTIWRYEPIGGIEVPRKSKNRK